MILLVYHIVLMSVYKELRIIIVNGLAVDFYGIYIIKIIFVKKGIDVYELSMKF